MPSLPPTFPLQTQGTYLQAQGNATPPDGASPVLMIRSLPHGTTEHELRQWASQFRYQPRNGFGLMEAHAVRALVLADRGIGFVQFADIWAARHVMNLFVYQPESIMLARPDGTRFPLNLVYSDRQEIRAGSALNGQRNGARRNGGLQPNMIGAPAPVSARPTTDASTSSGASSRLLLVVLKDLTEKIALDYLFWVFSQFGIVEKISSFTKDQKNQVVVQFNNAVGAEAALGYLNGKLLFQQGLPLRQLCFLAIVPSRLGQLTFRNEDSRNRDYSALNQALSTMLQYNPTTAMSAIQLLEMHALAEKPTMLPDFIWGQRRWGSGVLIPQQANEHLGRIPPPPTQGKVGECLHIAGLPEDDTIFGAEQLFRFCGSIEEVKAVKLLFKHKGCALVQFTSTEGRDAAIPQLHGLRFMGRSWDVKASNQPNAVHWNGSSATLQRRMCSVLDPHRAGRSPPCDARRAGSSAQSDRVVLWGIAQPQPGAGMDDEHLCQAAKHLALSFLQATIVRPIDAWTTSVDGQCAVVVRMPSSDDALCFIAMLNGEEFPQAAALWPDRIVRARFETAEDASTSPPPLWTPPTGVPRQSSSDIDEQYVVQYDPQQPVQRSPTMQQYDTEIAPQLPPAACLPPMPSLVPNSYAESAPVQSALFSLLEARPGAPETLQHDLVTPQQEVVQPKAPLETPLFHAAACAAEVAKAQEPLVPLVTPQEAGTQDGGLSAPPDLPTPQCSGNPTRSARRMLQLPGGIPADQTPSNEASPLLKLKMHAKTPIVGLSCAGASFDDDDDDEGSDCPSRGMSDSFMGRILTA